MKTRYDDLIERLRDAAQPDRPAPPEMARYLEKVRLHAYEDFGARADAMLSSGYSLD